MNDCGTAKCGTQMVFHELLDKAREVRNQARDIRNDVDERVNALVGVAPKPPTCDGKLAETPTLYDQMTLMLSAIEDSLSEIRAQVGRL